MFWVLTCCFESTALQNEFESLLGSDGIFRSPSGDIGQYVWSTLDSMETTELYVNAILGH